MPPSAQSTICYIRSFSPDWFKRAS